MILILAFVIVGFMAIEARRAAANERAQRSRGGIEARDDASVYAAMRVAYPGAFLAMLIEGAARGGPERDVFVMGAAIYVAAKALKWWAILELGRFWTFRVIVVPGTRPIRSGPYRYMRHPNYVGVFGELVGTALMTGALITGPIATLFFTTLMLRRSVVEHRALDAAR